MRLVDDFLLITPDLHEAQTFLKYDKYQHFLDIIHFFERLENTFSI